MILHSSTIDDTVHGFSFRYKLISWLFGCLKLNTVLAKKTCFHRFFRKNKFIIYLIEIHLDGNNIKTSKMHDVATTHKYLDAIELRN